MTHCWLVSVLLTVLLATPYSALGCSVCFVSKRENLMAFFGTGVLLSMLPFLLVGGIAFWLYRQAKEEREEKH